MGTDEIKFIRQTKRTMYIFNLLTIIQISIRGELTTTLEAAMKRRKKKEGKSTQAI